MPLPCLPHISSKPQTRSVSSSLHLSPTQPISIRSFLNQFAQTQKQDHHTAIHENRTPISFQQSSCLERRSSDHSPSEECETGRVADSLWPRKQTTDRVSPIGRRIWTKPWTSILEGCRGDERALRAAVIHLNLRIQFLRITSHHITCTQKGSPPQSPQPLSLSEPHSLQIVKLPFISKEHSTKPSTIQKPYQTSTLHYAAKESPGLRTRLICRNAGGMSLAICMSCHLLAVVGLSRRHPASHLIPSLFLAFKSDLIIALQKFVAW